MKKSHRLWLAIGAVLVAAACIVLAWQAWPKLLMFGGIVGIAAWGFGKQTRVKSRAKAVEAAALDEASATDSEHIV